MLWDIIKMNLIPIPKATPIIHINFYTAMVKHRCWITMEVLGIGGAWVYG